MSKASDVYQSPLIFNELGLAGKGSEFNPRLKRLLDPRILFGANTDARDVSLRLHEALTQGAKLDFEDTPRMPYEIALKDESGEEHAAAADEEKQVERASDKPYLQQVTISYFGGSVAMLIFFFIREIKNLSSNRRSIEGRRSKTTRC